MHSKIQKFFANSSPATPCLAVDLAYVGEKYERFKNAFGDSSIYYAVKANPAIPILQELVKLGAKFDVASIGEIRFCIEAGASPTDLSFSNTIKKQVDIVEAYEYGVRKYAFDSEEELFKLNCFAPNCHIFCRVFVPDDGSAWPLSDKFGCSESMAVSLLVQAKSLGFKNIGIAVHVGSQQTNSRTWATAVKKVSRIYKEAAIRNVDIEFINLGGGFPVHYENKVPEIEGIAATIKQSIERYFDHGSPELMFEPGRYIIAESGVIRSQIILVAKKSETATERWVYLDIGMYSGLAETAGEAIRYKLEIPNPKGPRGPVILAGPTCDGKDIIARRKKYWLPLALKEGDYVNFLSAGAYTTSYATKNFNGLSNPSEFYL